MKTKKINYYYKYYSEIKYRLFLILVNWLFTTLICYVYKNSLLFFLINANNNIIKNQKQLYFIFTDIHEIFYVNITIILFISNQICLILMCYHILIFLSLGLYKTELGKFKFLFKFSILTWFLSAFICYKLLIPTSWNFFLSFQKMETPQQPISLFFEAKLFNFFEYFIQFYNICFLSCQLFICLIFFLNNYIKTYKQIKINRKLFYIIFLFFSTIITPPDIVSQIIITLSLIITYEIFTFFKYLQFNLVTN